MDGGRAGVFRRQYCEGQDVLKHLMGDCGDF